MKTKFFFLVLVFMGFTQLMNAQVPSYVPTNGLVGYWGFSGNANDSSVNGNNGTVNGATLTTDRFGNANSAYSFNGSSNSISVPASNAFTQNPISYSFWFNKAGTGNPCSGNETFQAVFSTGSYSQSRDVVLGQGTAKRIGIQKSIPSGCANEFMQSTNYALNTWNHVVVSYEANLVKVYLNGVYIGSNPVTCNATTANTTCYIGASHPSIWACIAYFNGKIDDLAIYNRVLSDSEVTTLYNGDVAVTSCPPLSGTLTNGIVAYYPFCGNANDASGNNNNGTVNGATLTTDRFGNANSAYSFDGTSNFISCANAPLINVPFTISAWVNLNTLSGFSPILSLGDLGTNNLKKFYFSPVYGGIGKPSIGTGGANDITSTSIVVTPSNWVHVAVCVTSYSSTNVVFYVNGVSYNVNTTGGGNFPFPLNNSGFVIGKDAGTGGYSYFKGKIDDLSIYNRILTAQEITTLYGQNICYQSVTVTDTLIINTGILSYNPMTYNNTITIYPNPANDHITIDCGILANVVGYSIKITNTLGQEVFNQPMNTQQYYIPLNSWSGQGVYFVNVIDAQGHTIDIKKIILQ